MSERKTTGGAKEFRYTKEDLARIRSTDTQSTKAFKEAYKNWHAMKQEENFEEELKAQRLKLLFIAIGLTLAAIALLIISFYQ